MTTSLPSLHQPPTPPIPQEEDAITEALRFLDTSLLDAPQNSLATPPASSPNAPHTSSKPAVLPASTLKKIRFEPRAICIDEVLSDRGSPGSDTRLRDVPPSRLCKSAKSILKPGDGNALPGADYFGGNSPDKVMSLPDKLERATKDLACGTVAQRTQAYSTIRSCLQDSDDLVDHIRPKIPLLSAFIQRDLAAWQIGMELGSKRLAIQAVQLTWTLLSSEYELMSSFRQDFLMWLSEDTLRLLSSPRPQKEILKSQVMVFTNFTFLRRTVNTDRASKILSQLYTIYERVSGASIHVLRLWIMLRLVEQHPTLMLSEVRSWVPIMFHGLLSNAPQIRQHAMALAVRASNELGVHKEASSAVYDFLALHTRDGLTNQNLLERRLRQMCGSDNDDESLQVPRIWSAIIMLLRGSPRNLSEWSALPNWLKVIQRCFNRSNTHVHKRAFVAWNHLIATVLAGQRVRKAVLDNLTVPIFAYLRRRQSSKAFAHGRAAAYGSFRLLLFYAFRPDAQEGQWEQAWKSLIHTAIDQSTNSDPVLTRELMIVLHSLLDTSDVKVWNAGLANTALAQPVEVASLPLLEPSWVKAHLKSLVLPSVADLFALDGTSPATPKAEVQQQAAKSLWSDALKSVRVSSSKEIKVSTGTQTALKDISTFLLDLIAGKSDSKMLGQGVNVDHAWAMVDAAVVSLGPAFLQESGEGINRKATANTNAPVIISLVKVALSIIKVNDVKKGYSDLLATIKACAKNKDPNDIMSWFSPEEVEALHSLQSPDQNADLQAPAEQRDPEPPSTPPLPVMQRRLRHDDSQVDFVAIESSPHQQHPDSQKFTEHQLEARERQRDDAVLFSDFRSSSPVRQEEVSLKGQLRPENDVLQTSNANEAEQTDVRKAYEREVEIAAEDVPSSPPDDAGAAVDDAPQKEEGVQSSSSPEHDPMAADVEDEAQAHERFVGLAIDTDASSHVEDATVVQPTKMCAMGLDGQGQSVEETTRQTGDGDMHNAEELAQEAEVEVEEPHQLAETINTIEDATANKPKGPEATVEDDLDRHGEDEDTTAERAIAERPDDSSKTTKVSPEIASPEQSPSQQESVDVSENNSGSESDTNLIRAISHSPPHTRAMVRVDVPRTSTPQQATSSAATTAVTHTPAPPSTRGIKRKALSQPQTATEQKRSRVEDSAPRKTASQPLINTVDSDDEEGGCIILRKPTAETPSFYDVMRERAVSASQSQSSASRRSQSQVSPTPAAAARKRRASKGKETVAEKLVERSSRKRSASATGGDGDEERSPMSVKKRKTPERKKQEIVRTDARRPGRRRSTRNSKASLEDSPVDDETPSEPQTSKVPDTAQPDQERQDQDHAEEQRRQESPQPEFTFTPPDPSTPSSQRSSSSQASPPSSARKMIQSMQSVRRKLGELFVEAKKLWMGAPELAEERVQIEDAYDALGAEFRAAGRRRQ